MLIFGIAVSSLMALFPVSLRQGSMAVSDSVVTTFGDAVMNAIAGRAASMQSPDDWSTWKKATGTGSFPQKVIEDLTIDTQGSPTGGGNEKLALGEHVIKDYLGISKISSGGNSKSGVVNIKYRLDITPVDTVNDGKLDKTAKFGWRLYRAILHVTDNEYSDVVETGVVFVTYLLYLGEVPEPVEVSE